MLNSSWDHPTLAQCRRECARVEPELGAQSLPALPVPPPGRMLYAWYVGKWIMADIRAIGLVSLGFLVTCRGVTPLPAPPVQPGPQIQEQVPEPAPVQSPLPAPAPAPAPAQAPLPAPAQPPLPAPAQPPLPAPVQPPPPPAAPPAAAKAPSRPRIALVLGGGAARGFAHVGVIRALEQGHIPIDLVVGTSAGSLIGALYASNLDSRYLERTAAQLKKEDFFDYGLLTAVKGMGLAKGDKLEQWVRGHVRTGNIENLRIPFAAVATDLNWGREVVLDKGSVARAVRASSAIPGVFQPVLYKGRILVDGGVVDSLPIGVARSKGADLVIAVDVGSSMGTTRINNLVDVAMQAVNIMCARNAERSRREADVLIAPRVGDVDMLDFTRRTRCMKAGAAAARQALPGIRRAMAAWVAAHAVPAAPPAGPRETRLRPQVQPVPLTPKPLPEAP